MNNRSAMIKIVPLVALVIGAFLYVRPNQAKFYNEETLMTKATEARDKALRGAQCDEMKLAEQVQSPPGAVRLYVWECLSRSTESREVIVKILNDGDTQTVTNPLACRNDAAAADKGYLCTSA
ncbi:hypothetical protein [Pseudoduganella sp. GCM10020061]|uniref:hypothetical protein n=1 Tax=Pseudoduganella sp. GCM10020061 TaxID=3317345 RepID=UPI00362D8F13